MAKGKHSEPQDFKNFLRQLGMQNPDMDVIKEGILKYGTGSMTDAQRKAFMDRLFPKHKPVSSVGFENLAGINNAIKALNLLKNEANSPIDDTVIKKFLSEKNPHWPEADVSATVAYNVMANEFKTKRITDEDTLNKLQGRKEQYDSLIANLKEIEAPLLKESMIQEIIPQGNNNQHRDEREGDNSMHRDEGDGHHMRVGGGPGRPALDVGRENNGVTIQAEEEDEKVGEVDGNKGKDPSHGEPYKVERVKEQDIVQYMFNDWFLEGLTAVMNFGFKCGDYLLDAALRHAEVVEPKSSGTATVTPNRSAVNFMNTSRTNAYQACSEVSDAQREYYNALHSMVADNIGKGKPLSDWAAHNLADGSLVLNPSNPNDLNLVKDLEAQYASLGKDKFLQKWAKLPEQFGKEAALLKNQKLMEIASSIAMVCYMTSHPDEDYSEGKTEQHQQQIDKLARKQMRDIIETSKTILLDKEQEYRINNGKETQPLDAKDIQKIQAAAANEFKQYMEGLLKCTGEVNKKLNDYYNATDAATQETRKNEMWKKKEELQSQFTYKPLGNADTAAIGDTLKTVKSDIFGPVGLHQAALDNNNFEERNAAVLKTFSLPVEALEGEKAKNGGKKTKVAKLKDKILGNEFIRNMFSVSNTGGRF